MFFNVVFFSPLLTWPLNKERAYYSYNTTTPNWCHFLKLIPILFCGLKKKIISVSQAFFSWKAWQNAKSYKCIFQPHSLLTICPFFLEKKYYTTMLLHWYYTSILIWNSVRYVISNYIYMLNAMCSIYSILVNAMKKIFCPPLNDWELVR